MFEFFLFVSLFSTSFYIWKYSCKPDFTCRPCVVRPFLQKKLVKVEINKPENAYLTLLKY